MRISTLWHYQQSVNTMLSQQSTLAQTQNEVSTGKRINVASDDPTGAAQIVAIDHTLAQNNGYTSGINAANTRLSTESSTLSSVTNLLDRAQSLALSAMDGSMSSQNRASIAGNLVQVRNQLLQYANTTDANGNALFAGTSNTTVPFSQNADGSVSYQGNATQQMALIGSGLQIPTGDAGSAVFMNIPAGNGSFVASAGSANTGTLVVGSNSVTDPAAWKAAESAAGGQFTISFDASGNWTVADASGNPVNDASGNPITGTYSSSTGSISFDGMSVSLSGTPAAGDTVTVQANQKQDIFSTLNQMINALQGSGSNTQITNTMNRQLESLDQALGTVSNVQVQVGGRIDELNQQSTAYSSLGVTYQSALSNVQNVDAYSAISNLSLQSAALQASQQSFAAVKSLSLFNYLQ
ncbi:flagellar hook-associated protein FlgL [Dyella sp. A6]|uniref:flagellar hook-associated protein FlgL n=1 Tax=Dyella aluminiiresistens TaxID=3069105 RepID=UPI002E79399C|nr:flagellar hook-associated protein FlgL [Dyella sp. A6]